ncbi:MAG: GtrA family protein [Clostridia bacterium]|nr:GtrA family protein [Clostridia bacterium]
MVSKLLSIGWIKQFFKFGIVGVINTGITLLAVYILMNLFSVSYKIANPIGYILGFVNSFFFNKHWTFKSTGSIKKESFMFVVIAGVSYLLQYGLVIFLVESLRVEQNLAQLIGMPFYTALGFVGNKLFNFKNK